MRTLITILVVISSSLVFANVSKVDDNSLKMTVESVYSFEQLSNRIDQLKSERDGQQSNLNLLNAEIARLQKMIDDTGIKAKPVEVKDEATETKTEE